MKKIFITLLGLIMLSSCGTGGNSSDLVGTWKEYRVDPSDNYLLSTWKFNSDGSGLFIVGGFSNTQKTSFMWEKVNSSTIKISMNGSSFVLEVNNGMLFENSASGTTVYRKQ